MTNSKLQENIKSQILNSKPQKLQSGHHPAGLNNWVYLPAWIYQFNLLT